jgi:helicase SWR1
MQSYFDGLEMKRLKAKELEEKRLRNLAKSTMRMVIAEWKKAVFHIREKQRLVEEERKGG